MRWKVRIVWLMMMIHHNLHRNVDKVIEANTQETLSKITYSADASTSLNERMHVSKHLAYHSIIQVWMI